MRLAGRLVLLEGRATRSALVPLGDPGYRGGPDRRRPCLVAATV